MPTETGKSPSGPSGTEETILIEVSDQRPGHAGGGGGESPGSQWPCRGGRSKGSGIGFRNVHRRIRLTFGADYGLTIFSEPDDGTTVRIRLPALDEEAARRYRKEGEA